MIVLVDANIIVADPDLRSGVWAQLSVAVAAGRARVIIPEIAVEEAVAKRKQNLKAIGRTIREKALRATNSVQELAQEAQSECLRVGEHYEQALQEAWTDAGFEIVVTASVDHVDVARRAIQRIRPFNDQGNGYRDTLHWLTLIGVARTSPNEDMTLLTGDAIFATKGDGLFSTLIDEFLNVSDATITLCRRLNALEVPGHYVTDPVDAFEYELSLGKRLLDLFHEEDALRKIRTSGLSVPQSDWDDLYSVGGLIFTAITSRQVENQANPDLEFEAVAVFTIRGTYISENDDSEAPQLSTRDVDLKVQISGVSTTLGSNKVGVFRTVEANYTGDDLHLVEELVRAGEGGLSPTLRIELERVFGRAAVSRAQEDVRNDVQ